MTPLKVRAQVVDIRSDEPGPDDRIWVDTQVWVVLSYLRVPPKRLSAYPRYVKRAQERAAKLVAGTIHLAELARCVEHHELEVYSAQTSSSSSAAQMNIKSFRKIESAREEVVAQIASAWRVLTSMASLSVEAVNVGDIEKTIKGLQAGELLDPGDAIQLAEARRQGINLILSDDSDFATVEGIILLTANEGTLRAAAAQGRSLRRRS